MSLLSDFYTNEDFVTFYNLIKNKKYNESEDIVFEKYIDRARLLNHEDVFNLKFFYKFLKHRVVVPGVDKAEFCFEPFKKKRPVGCQVDFNTYFLCEEFPYRLNAKNFDTTISNRPLKNGLEDTWYSVYGYKICELIDIVLNEGFEIDRDKNILKSVIRLSNDEIVRLFISIFQDVLEYAVESFSVSVETELVDYKLVSTEGSKPILISEEDMGILNLTIILDIGKMEVVNEKYKNKDWNAIVLTAKRKHSLEKQKTEMFFIWRAYDDYLVKAVLGSTYLKNFDNLMKFINLENFPIVMMDNFTDRIAELYDAYVLEDIVQLCECRTVLDVFGNDAFFGETIFKKSKRTQLKRALNTRLEVLNSVKLMGVY